jgi:hypothetical protein
MKANLLAPEFESQERSRLTPNFNYPTQLATAKCPRSETPVAKLLRPLDQLSQSKRRLYTTRIFTGDDRASSKISRYVFEGEQSSGSPIRIGIFAGLRGNDAVGPGAVATFLEDLVALPHLGNNLRIYAYPVVNATGFEVATPSSERRQYIINQIGCKTVSAETYQIEREIFAIAFDGVITIRSDDERKHFKVGISDAHLQETFVRPILSALEPFLPVEEADGDSGRSLTDGLSLKRRPVELTLSLPSSGWPGLYSIGLRIALHLAVDGFRRYMVQRKNSYSLGRTPVLPRV